MRCLYCNKELALLKRLTGGAEFCSDAHRKKYQEEFNDLALSRLMQAPPPPAPAPPLAPPEEPKPEVVPEPVAAPVPTPRPRATQAAGPKLVANAAPRAERKSAQPKDPAIASYLIEQPVGKEIAAAVPAGEPPFPASTSPELPIHAFKAVASEGGFSHASPIALTLTIERRPALIRPRDGNVEIREFSRKAVTPSAPPQQNIRTTETALSSAIGEAMEITNQPRPPADPPMIWQADPQPAPIVDLLLGDLSRLDYPTTGFGEDLPPEHPVRAAQPFASAPAVASVDPVAAAPVAEIRETVAPEAVPVPQPVVAAQPAAAPVPAPVTEALPITLHGIGAGTAKPASIISAGVSATIEPQVPPSSALPLRPTMILSPRPQPVSQPAPVVAPTPTPVAAAVPTPAVAPPASAVAAPQPAPVANTTPVRPVRGPNGKNRRPEVRVIQTGGQAAAPPAQSAPSPVQPARVTPSPVAPTPAPVAKAPVAPAKPAPTPQAAPPPAPAKETVKTEAPRPAPKPELDLNLPELHNPEVMSPWAKLPGAAKAGLGAVLALAIIGVAYTVFNGNNASATTTPAANLVPAYNLGKQINSGGWIEDWAPNDSLRRVTLLRGSQPYSDYRIEFQAQIQNKAIGWMYRGLNPKNFYVVKLEKLKGGIEPVVALVRYAVIDGDNEKRSEKILPMKVRVDTTYKIRFDAVGTEFAVWIQDKKVDEWRDSRLGSGGVGLYSEGEEAASVNGTVNVFELVSTK